MNMSQKTGLSIHVRNSIRRQLIIQLMLMRRLVYHHDPYENERHPYKIEDIEHLSVEDISNYGAHDDLKEQYDG